MIRLLVTFNWSTRRLSVGPFHEDVALHAEELAFVVEHQRAIREACAAFDGVDITRLPIGDQRPSGTNVSAIAVAIRRALDDRAEVDFADVR